MSVDQPAVTGPSSAATTAPAPVADGLAAAAGAPAMPGVVAPARVVTPPGAAPLDGVSPRPAVAPTTLGAPAVASSSSGPRRGRRVKRVVRRVELWSVLKLSLVLYTCLYIAVLLAVAGLWGFLNSGGLVKKFESFMRDVGFDKWQFHGAEMFRGVAAGGAVLVLAVTLLTVLATGLVNVISELTGGIRITVIEEDPDPRPVASSRSRRDGSTRSASAPKAKPAGKRRRGQSLAEWEESQRRGTTG